MFRASRIVKQQVASAALKERVARKSFLEKLKTPEELVGLFKNDMHIGWSGFTGVGYPKMVPSALADHVEKNNLQDDPATKLKFNLYVGASTGPETENRWADLDMISRRYPHQVGKSIAKRINQGDLEFSDIHLSKFPQDLEYGYYTLNKKTGDPRFPLDYALIEATEILEDGSLILGASVGATPEIIQSAEKIIIEVNTHLPSFRGLHDIAPSYAPPYRQPILISHASDRIGLTSMPIDPERVVAIVESNKPDNTGKNAPQDDISRAIGSNLINFFSDEVKAGRLPNNLAPIQSGIGNIANAVIGALEDSPFEHLTVWTEVLQDSFIPLLDSNKLDFATATSIRFSPEMFAHLYDNWSSYKDRLLLRPQSVANSAEIIRRLGVIATNTPLEVDITSHVNSTCALGTRILNGLGGSNDFLGRSRLSIVHTPSTRPTKTDPHGISCIVAFASHIDHTEHDIDVIVTEQGLADIRGLSPRERAPVIINNCAHPVYRDQLMDYYERALHENLARGAGHQPHMLRNAFLMHENLREHGTMRLDKWLP